MYKFTWLCAIMQRRDNVVLLGCDNKTYHGMINGISVEDGSGKNWLVSLALVGGGCKTIFVKAE